ncbi:MAG: hypothetical protein ACD_22C00041G0010 [uncultured bacterium]|nr:MAG: hypothetical protein ACD_22C00041G0010 [uncultured bacterium]
MKKIITLVGARPQYIKEAMLNKALAKTDIQEVLVNSGQHYDYNMSDIFFKHLNIKQPDYNLNVGSGKHGEMTGKIMTEFEKVVEKEKPDMVIVFGDINTTLAGALVTRKCKISLGHVEAGLRMLPSDMPEEINRVVTDRIANLLFVPSQVCMNNLKKENITKGAYLTGDITYDLFLHSKNFFNLKLKDSLGLSNNEYVLCTIHRDYNVDNKEILEKILKQLTKINKEERVVLPMHPRTKKRVEDFGLSQLLSELLILEPIGYFDLMGLLQDCAFVITDSGGFQKEAYFAKKRSFVVMPDTGWTELLDLGLNVLCNENNLYEQINLEKTYEYVPDIYGDGTAAEKIVDILLP